MEERFFFLTRWSWRDPHDRLARIGRHRTVRDPIDSLGVLALGNRFDALAQHLAQHGDAAVRRAEVLGGMDRDRPLADLGVVVPGETLPFLVGAVAIKCRVAGAGFDT